MTYEEIEILKRKHLVAMTALDTLRIMGDNTTMNWKEWADVVIQQIGKIK